MNRQKITRISIFIFAILFCTGCSEVEKYQIGKEQRKILTLQKQSLYDIEYSSARYNCFNYLESNFKYNDDRNNKKVSEKSKQSYEELQLAEIRAKQANITDDLISTARDAGAAIGRASAIEKKDPDCFVPRKNVEYDK